MVFLLAFIGFFSGDPEAPAQAEGVGLPLFQHKNVLLDLGVCTLYYVARSGVILPEIEL